MLRYLLPLLLLGACATVEPRLQTTAEAIEHCKATAHSPLVNLGIDPERTTIRHRGWSYNGRLRLGEFSAMSMRVWTVDHPEPMYHEFLHRGLRLIGERFSNPGGMFRDEEHPLIYHLLDRDFPGLQDHRIHKELRRRGTARWTSPGYAERLRDFEARARAADSWCRRNV